MKIMPLMTLLLASLSSFALSGCSGNNQETADPEQQQVNQKIVIKKLTTGTDGSGNPYQTFSFTVANTYLKTATTATLTFADNRNNGNNYLTVSINESDPVNRTVTVTCLAAFDSQATITLTNGNASGSVTVDYQQKYLGIEGISGSMERYLDYNSQKYDPTSGDPSRNSYDQHDSLLDLLNTFYSSPFWYINKSSTYTISLSGYDDAEVVSWYVPHGVSYSNYGDMIKSSNYASTDEQITYQSWFIPALSNCLFADDQIGYNYNFRGIYISLHTTFATLSNSVKSSISSYLNGASYLPIEFTYFKNMNLEMNITTVNQSAILDLEKTLTLYVKPMSIWGL